jgi:hypothetical protein
MSETVLGIDLKVTCADHGVHEGVVMKIVDDRVIYLTTDGEELKGDCRVINIDHSCFLVPMNFVAMAIDMYRKQG